MTKEQKETEERAEEETPPWKWFAPDNSKTLIIGTFPTAKHNWYYEFFYPIFR